MAAKSSIASDFSSSHNSHKDLREENDLRFPQSYVKADAPKKKTTFKITSVTKSSQRGGSGDLLSQENDLDSLDDLDETIDSHTEDLSSEILDSRATDIDSQDPLLTPEEIVKENEPKEKPARFKVVKVETKEPFKRGRWVCCDYLDAPDKIDNKTEEINVKSGGAGATSSVHYVHGVDDPTKNPLLAGATGTAFTYQQTSASQDGLTQDEIFKPLQPSSSSQAGLILDPANYMSSFSSKAAQSSKPYGSQTGGPDRSAGQSLTGASRSGSAVPVLPPMQQGETQTSQSLSGNIPFPTPDGRSQQLPILQGSTIPSSGHSQPALSATSPYQPPVQDYVTAAGQSQVSTSQSQQIPPYQQQMLYQDMSSQQSGFSLNNGAGGSATNSLPQAALPYDGYRSDSPKLSISGSSLGNLTSLRSEGIQDTRPALGAGLAQIAVGGVATGGPGDDDITEEAVSQSRQPPFASRRPSLRTQVRNHIGIIQSSASAVAIDNKIEQAMVSLDGLNTQLRQNSESNAPLENKVAQSMDLVKSHLMYAVREEVEVLKEVIKELMERMHKVEQENKVLRSEATPETLSRLPPPLPPVQKPLLQQLMVSLNSSSLPSSSSSS